MECDWVAWSGTAVGRQGADKETGEGSSGRGFPTSAAPVVFLVACRGWVLIDHWGDSYSCGCAVQNRDSVRTQALYSARLKNRNRWGEFCPSAPLTRSRGAKAIPCCWKRETGCTGVEDTHGDTCFL